MPVSTSVSRLTYVKKNGLVDTGLQGLFLFGCWLAVLRPIGIWGDLQGGNHPPISVLPIPRISWTAIGCRRPILLALPMAAEAKLCYLFSLLSFLSGTASNKKRTNNNFAEPLFIETCPLKSIDHRCMLCCSVTLLTYLTGLTSIFWLTAESERSLDAKCYNYVQAN